MYIYTHLLHSSISGVQSSAPRIIRIFQIFILLFLFESKVSRDTRAGGLNSTAIGVAMPSYDAKPSTLVNHKP